MRLIHLDAHQKPPEYLRILYKRYQKMQIEDLNQDPYLVDFSQDVWKERGSKSFHLIRKIHAATSCTSLSFSGPLCPVEPDSPCISVYEHVLVPGLHIVPALLSPEVQWQLLSSLLHRDLADERHNTNIHTHYKVPYQLCLGGTNDPSEGLAISLKSEKGSSFFNCSPDTTQSLEPIDPNLHKPISISQFLCKKLRWMTLGGQYDWTRKKYPQGTHPAIPEDIAHIIHGFFPDMRPEAAIVNLYSPGDTLSLHRDVSEESDHGLVSVSLGCDGIFIVGLDGIGECDPRWMVIRLHSGDAVYMSGSSRYAWHGVPQILPGTCPVSLGVWPATQNTTGSAEAGESRSKFKDWQGWMATKRVNLNVRQMSD